MAKIHGKDVYLRVGGNVIDSDGNSATLDISVDTAEITSYGDDFKGYLEGVADFTLSADFFFEPTEAHAADVAFDQIGSGPVAVTYCPEGNAKPDSIRYYGNMDVTRKGVTSPVGGAATLSLSFQGTGSLTKGVVIDIDDCEDIWDEAGSIGAGASNAVDTDSKRGTNSIKITEDGGSDAGDYLAMEVVSADLTTCTYVSCWVKSSTVTSAGDLKLHLSKTALMANITESLSLPALVADTWTQLDLALVDPADCGAIVSIAVEMDVELGAFTLYVDDIRGV